MGTRSLRKGLLFGMAGILAWAAVPEAGAANLNATPSLTLGASWDSNIFNTASDEESDYVFRAAPRLSLSLEGPTTRAELTGGIEGEKYADHEELDEATATKSAEFRLTRTGPRLTITPSARFVETNDVTRRGIFSLEPAPVPEPGFLPEESVIAERIRSKIYSGALPLSYLLSPKLTLGLGGSAAKREYVENVSGLTGSRTVAGNASLIYSFTPRASAGVFFATSYNSYDGFPNSRTYTGGLRGTYRATEHTTVSASGGATLLRESTGVGDEVNEEWSPSGNLSLAYARQDFRAVLSGSYAVSGGGSFGRTTKRGTVSLALSDRLGRSWFWDLAGAWQNNRSTGRQIGTKVDIDTASGTAGLRFQAASWASFRLSGNIYRQRSKTSFGQDLDRETALLELILGNTFQLL